MLCASQWKLRSPGHSRHQGLGRVPGFLLRAPEVKNELSIFCVTGKDANHKKATQTIAMRWWWWGQQPVGFGAQISVFFFFSPMKQHWEPVSARLVPPPSLRSRAFLHDSPSCWLAALGVDETLGQAARLSVAWPSTLSAAPRQSPEWLRSQGFSVLPHLKIRTRIAKSCKNAQRQREKRCLTRCLTLTKLITRCNEAWRTNAPCRQVSLQMTEYLLPIPLKKDYIC